MLYIVIERFKGGDPLPVYRRFRDQGRLTPGNLKYLASWVTQDMVACYQLMECHDLSTLNEWMARLSDLVDFEVVPVVTSAEAVDLIAAKLDETSP